MILKRADSVSKRIAATLERSNNTERLHTRPRAKRDSELGAARQLRTAGKKIREHADANEILWPIECARRYLRLR